MMNRFATLLMGGAVCFSPLSNVSAAESPAHTPNDHAPKDHASETHVKPTHAPVVHEPVKEHHVEANPVHHAPVHQEPLAHDAKKHEPVSGNKSVHTPSKPEPVSADNLQDTQDRLNKLIKAATRKDRGDKKTDGPYKPKVEKYAPRDAHGRCVAEEIFDFHGSTRVSDYAELTTLKHAIVTGPDQVDAHKVRIVTLAHIGLGFGAEAKHFSGYLKGREKRVLDAMAHIVSGKTSAKDIARLDIQSGCYDKAVLWAQFARAQLADSEIQLANTITVEEASLEVEAREAKDHAVDTHALKGHTPKGHGADTHQLNEHMSVHAPRSAKPARNNSAHEGVAAHVVDGVHDEIVRMSVPVELTKQQYKQMAALPKNLGALMMQRFGLDAMERGDVKTAKHFMKMIKKAQKKHEIDQIFDDEGKFFEALYMLETGDKAAFPILNALARRDGRLQVRALQTLATAELKTGHKTYSGYEEDLDGAAHIFSEQPEGQQALAEKIGFFVSTGALNQAIGMTKEKFSPADEHYMDSVVLVSARMQSQFLGHDDTQKLQALNTLLREHVFFDALVDSFPLRSAGVSASLDIGLAELAPRVLSTDQWHRLDIHVLRELAAALPDEMKSDLPAKAFSGPAMEVLEIKTAFQARKPKIAMAALRKIPENKDALKMAANQAWEAGYWGVARDAIDDLSKTDEGAKEHGLKAKKDLASVLSVPSPHLTPAQNSQSIDDLETLQTFLDKDIEIIKEYVNGG